MGETLNSLAEMEPKELSKEGREMRGPMGGGGGPDSLWKVQAASQRRSIEMVRNQGIVVVPVGSTNGTYSFSPSTLCCLGLPALEASSLLKESIQRFNLGSSSSYHSLDTEGSKLGTL